jgi:hypothetical protein
MALKYLDAATPPIQDPVIDPKNEHRLTESWLRWFGRLPSMLQSIPNIINTIQVAGESDSLPATDFSNTSLEMGLYRATYRVQITQAATVSSSLVVTFSWTDGGVAQSASGTAIVGNTTSTGQSDTILLHVDAGTEVQYSTTYASVGATPMVYSFYTSLELVQR